MPTYASIPRRSVLIALHPGGGWSFADEGTPGSFEIEFRFDITDDGGGNYLLVCSSIDGRFAADTWHETLPGAYVSAADGFGISAHEWSRFEIGQPALPAHLQR